MALVTILFADDNEIVRKLMCPALLAQEYEVLEAADGMEAMAVASQYPCSIDLLISDVMMPGLNGPALAGRLKQSRPKIKVLFITGHSNYELEPEAFLLYKPFAPSSLVRKVAEILVADPPVAVSRAASCG